MRGPAAHAWRAPLHVLAGLAAATSLPAARGLQLDAADMLTAELPLHLRTHGVAGSQKEEPNHGSAVRLHHVDEISQHPWSVMTLVVSAAAGVAAFRVGAPTNNRCMSWTISQRSWLGAAMLQVVVIAGTLSLFFIGLPGHVTRWHDFELWKLGAVLGALPAGHAIALPLYPRLLRLLWHSEGAVCAGASVLRGLLLLHCVHTRSFAALAVTRLLLGATCAVGQTSMLGFLHLHWPCPEELTLLLGYQDAALSLGSMIGCCFGAILFMYGYAAPFWAAATLNILMGLLMLSTFHTPAYEEKAAGLPSLTSTEPRRDCEDSLEASPCGSTPCSWAEWPSSMGPTASTGGGASGAVRYRGAPGRWLKVWHPWTGIVSAGLGVLLAAAAATFWEPLLALHLPARFPQAFATPLDVGAAWAAIYALQTVLNVVAARSAALAPSRLTSLWTTTGGWALLAVALFLTATPAKADGALWQTLAGLGLFFAASVMLWATSMPRLIEAAALLAPATAESVVPQVWIMAYGLGEALGPLAATLAAAGLDGVSAAAVIGAMVACCVAASILAGTAGATGLEWCIEAALRD
mmetsp:Transcript_84413/g.217403  ORF Transcript_84413/g.217403 Transcript_84413/m.217403 type:complete len:579 (-) Transcript_84413:215-1951(-)